MDEVEVVVAHQQRATVRVGEIFLKIDGDHAGTEVEVEAMRLAPVPTAEVLWRQPPALALATLRGSALGRLGEPSTASPAAWAAAGAAVRRLHDAPLPPWRGRSLDEKGASLEHECAWILDHDVLPADLVTRNREAAQAVVRPWRSFCAVGGRGGRSATVTRPDDGGWGRPWTTDRIAVLSRWSGRSRGAARAPAA